MARIQLVENFCFMCAEDDHTKFCIGLINRWRIFKNVVIGGDGYYFGVMDGRVVCSKTQFTSLISSEAAVSAFSDFFEQMEKGLTGSKCCHSNSLYALSTPPLCKSPEAELAVLGKISAILKRQNAYEPEVFSEAVDVQTEITKKVIALFQEYQQIRVKEIDT